MSFYFVGGLWPELNQALTNEGHTCHLAPQVTEALPHMPSYLALVGETDLKGGNERLLRHILDHNAEVVVVFRGWEHENMRFTADTVKELKKRGIYTVYWCLDDPFFFDLHGYKHEHTKHYDCILTCCEGLLDRYKQECGHNNVHVMYPAWDRVMWEDVEVPEEDKVDFTIIGSAYKKPFSRFAVGRQILRAGMKLEIYGPKDQWDVDEILIRHHKGYWDVQDMDTLYNRTRVNFTSHIRPDGFKYLNSRIFEVLGTGNFLLCDMVQGIDQIFTDGQELVLFHTLSDLVEKARYYVNNPEERNAIAQRGKKWIIKNDHTYTGRAAELLSYIQ